MSEEKFDAIVIGAGPAGSAASYVLAKAGLNVVLLERGEYPGAKNVMGGVFYRSALDKLIPEFWKEAPLERHIIEQRLWILDNDSAFKVGYGSEKFSKEPYNCFTVLRAKFDQWFAKKAEDAGAFLIAETLAEDLIFDGNKVIGVKTGREDGDLYADVVIIADGVNSTIAKKAKFREDLKTKNVALAVKEIISLPKEKIEDRFNLQGNEGVTIEIVGKSTDGMIGTGFLYTNKDSISIGVGALLSDFAKNNKSPNDLIEAFKSHPAVKPLLAGGETKEYMAHLIPEGGYDVIPKLYGDGWLIAGDAGMLVNSVHREGSNLAITSGRLAAETVLKAKEKADFTSNSLSLYRQLLEQSFILKDLKKYRKIPELFEKNSHFFKLYPEFINEASLEFFTIDGTSKQ